MKKSIALFSAACVLATGLGAFVGCGGDKDKENSKTVMNVSLNPEVEFVLDSDNKVVSVNALNEEGNLVISAEAFENVEGKSAEEAAKLFVQVSAETGFLVSGTASDGENEVEIEFSCNKEEAKALYQGVKSKVETYLADKAITVKMELEEGITEEELEALVAECAPYMDKAEIAALNTMELVETIYESRKETADFYSQELKNAYYEAKAFAMQQVEYETMAENIDVLHKLACDTAFELYSGAVELIETTRLTMLVNENSPYQIALKAFREAKTAYLNYRSEVAAMEQTEKTEAILERLASLEKVVEDTEEALLKAGADANAQLDTLKERAKEAYDEVIEKLNEANVKAKDHAKKISENQKAKQEEFFTKFESDYAASIEKAKTDWANMKTELENRTAEGDAEEQA